MSLNLEYASYEESPPPSITSELAANFSSNDSVFDATFKPSSDSEESDEPIRIRENSSSTIIRNDVAVTCKQYLFLFIILN